MIQTTGVRDLFRLSTKRIKAGKFNDFIYIQKSATAKILQHSAAIMWDILKTLR
jgi:hypothetical protein